MKSRTQAGRITYNKTWRLSGGHKMALKRLSELGIDVSSSMGEADFVFNIPHGLSAPVCVEAGFLMAQLCKKRFPDGYGNLSDVVSKVLRKQKMAEIEFVDSHPHGLKYRINL
jgi:hypothetical protein